jgi:hypothetical protein
MTVALLVAGAFAVSMGMLALTILLHPSDSAEVLTPEEATQVLGGNSLHRLTSR